MSEPSGIPQAIQEDVNVLSQKIAQMRSVIQEVRVARKKLHDDTEAWVKNNIKHALESVSQAQQEATSDSQIVKG